MPVLPAPLVDRLTDPDADPQQDRVRLRFAGGLFLMGVLHFVAPGPFRKIVPRWIPRPREAVLWSGVAEVASGALIAVPRTTRIGGWLATGTILGVYPANVQMAIDAARSGSRGAKAATWLRLPLQLPMLAKAWSFTR